jgi:sulfite reductase beta subunit-like hemoprotein
MRTRNVASLIEEEIRSNLGAEAIAARLPVHVSGCPNGCAQHHVAAIGLQGSVRRVGERLVPQFFILAGGEAGSDGATFGQLIGKVPARRVPEAVRALVALYLDERADGERAKGALGPCEALRPEELTEEDYQEPGVAGGFTPAAGESECAA